MGCCCCVSASEAAPPPPAYVGTWLSEGLQWSDINAGYGVHRAKKGYRLIRVAQNAQTSPAPYVKMKVDASGYSNYARKEANGFCILVDMYARSWDQQQADFGCCAGKLQITYDQSEDVLVVDGVRLRRCDPSQ
eukprot:Skav213311  [mRNA]  locus=scaffold1383:111977:114041:+ [translate_table: standard]